MPRPSHPSATLGLPSTSTTTSTPSPLHRLPVNPRRKKVAPDERKRVATACNVRRIKCSGERPCRQCTTSQRECLYPEPIERVTIPRAELESLQRRCASLERQLAATERGGHLSEAAPQQPGSVPSAQSLTNAGPADPRLSLGDADLRRPNPPGGIDGRMLADPTGTPRYLGETSGATFLDTLKELIVTVTPLVRVLNRRSTDAPAGAAFLGSVGQYQTHDSRPLMLPEDVNPLALPPEADVAAALSQVRYFIQDGSGAFASGGIMFWPFEDAQSILALASHPGVPGSVGPGGRTVPGPHHRSLALYHAAFALTRLLNLREPGSFVDGQLGEESFAKARALLGNVLDRTTYTISDIATLALMAVYFIENNRRDAAYMAIRNAMAISVMNGIHKGVAVNEVSVRTFWTVYVLDRWLDCIMGRPPSTPDDAITLPLPREFPGLPSPIGLRAHVELCKISNYIVYSSYREAGLPDLLNRATVRVDKVLEMLRKWHENLPPPLRLPDPLTLLPADLFTQASAFGRHDPAVLLSGAAEFGTDRACWALHMSFYQLVILSVRPAMLMAVWKAVASILCLDQPFDIESHPSITPIRACSDAARCNLRLGRLMRLHSPRKKLLLPDLHHIFNAAIVLMMHQIVFVNLRTQDLDDIEFASEVFDAEAETGSEYGKDCARVLRDMKSLAHQLRSPIHDPETKRLLLSDKGLLHDLMLDETMAADMMADVGGNRPGGPPDESGSSAPQAGHGAAYHRAAAMYQTLSSWWKADYMQFYNTFLS
ncbi:350fac74-ea02-4724-bed3-172135972bed [Thermothielavioides terrestris]|uniref:350fac74-ea02-4724-bed3-172135972bed n=1 Tax=Thermothielavioides terrestris TaxID=2587410 RepID=A0A3S4B738_9PEZI|nr:350fac74-ea02-4724-bed3-172135972bed [Thermothielavioides terrestris]